MIVFWQVVLILWLVVGATIAACIWAEEVRGARKNGEPFMKYFHWSDLPLMVGITLALVLLWPLMYVGALLARLLGEPEP